MYIFKSKCFVFFFFFFFFSSQTYASMTFLLVTQGTVHKIVHQNVSYILTHEMISQQHRMNLRVMFCCVLFIVKNHGPKRRVEMSSGKVT